MDPHECETFAERVRHVALGLALRGIRRGDRVRGFRRTVPSGRLLIWRFLVSVQLMSYLHDAGSRSGSLYPDRLWRSRSLHFQPPALQACPKSIGRLGFLEKLIFFDAEGTEGIEHSRSLASLEEAGQEHTRTPCGICRNLSAVQPQESGTIIYTSGTTGEPKGVMLSHNNFISNVLAITDALPISSTDVALSVLPLSHIFERTGFYIFCYAGVSVYYAASFDQVGENLKEVQPTVMTAVPRVFEKVYHRILKKGMAEKGWKREVFLRSLAVGQRYAELKDKRQRVPAGLALRQKIATVWFFSNGAQVLRQTKVLCLGGRPTLASAFLSFLAAGIPVLQGYGATEPASSRRIVPKIITSVQVGSPFPESR